MALDPRQPTNPLDALGVQIPGIVPVGMQPAPLQPLTGNQLPPDMFNPGSAAQQVLQQEVQANPTQFGEHPSDIPDDQKEHLARLLEIMESDPTSVARERVAEKLKGKGVGGVFKKIFAGLEEAGRGYMAYEQKRPYKTPFEREWERAAVEDRAAKSAAQRELAQFAMNQRAGEQTAYKYWAKKLEDERKAGNQKIAQHRADTARMRQITYDYKTKKQISLADRKFVADYNAKMMDMQLKLSVGKTPIEIATQQAVAMGLTHGTKEWEDTVFGIVKRYEDLQAANRIRASRSVGKKTRQYPDPKTNFWYDDTTGEMYTGRKWYNVSETEVSPVAHQQIPASARPVTDDQKKRADMFNSTLITARNNLAMTSLAIANKEPGMSALGGWLTPVRAIFGQESGRGIWKSPVAPEVYRVVADPTMIYQHAHSLVGYRPAMGFADQLAHAITGVADENYKINALAMMIYVTEVGKLSELGVITEADIDQSFGIKMANAVNNYRRQVMAAREIKDPEERQRAIERINLPTVEELMGLGRYRKSQAQQNVDINAEFNEGMGLGATADKYKIKE